MESKVKSLGHPIHPMLVNFPLGLLMTSAVFDIIHLITGNGYWSGIALWMIAAGVITGLLAAIVGTIDAVAIPSGTRARESTCDSLCPVFPGSGSPWRHRLAWWRTDSAARNRRRRRC